MNNLLSYRGLVEVRINASEKDLPVPISIFFLFFADFQMILVWEERPLRKKEFATNQKSARVKVAYSQKIL